MQLIPLHGDPPAPSIVDQSAPEPYRFALTCRKSVWSLSGDGVRNTDMVFANLADALARARDIAGGRPANIELWADGLYVFIQQTDGWPHRITGAARPPARWRRRL